MFTDLKPYPAYRRSNTEWLAPVPVHWELRRMRYLLREVDRRSTSGAEQLLRVSQYTGVTERKSRRREDGPDTRAASLIGYKRVCPNDLVINIMLAWNGSLGSSRYEGIVSPAYCVYRFAPGSCSTFYHHLLRSPTYRGRIKAMSTGVVESRLRLYSDQLYRIEGLVPPADEQAAIVKYLGHANVKIDRAIAVKRKLIALLEEQKQVVINQAVTRGLDPTVSPKDSSIPWLGEIPYHWQVWPIGRLARVGNGSTPSRTTPEFWQDGNYPWLNSSFANKREVLEADQFVTTRALAQCHLPIVPPGSVIVAITGQGKTRGKAALLKMEATINQHLAYLTPDPRRLIGPFLQAVLVAAYPELRRISDDSGSTKGALTCQDLKAFRVPVPPLVEQAQIVQWIRDETEMAEVAAGRAARQIGLLREFRTRLTADVVTGQVDIRAAAARLQELDLSDLVTNAGESDEDDLDAERAESLDAVDA